MAAQSDWYTSFFFDFFGELQLDHQAEEQTRAEVDALERELGLSEPRRILDVPCGAGRHSLELARRGHRVTGVDFNPKVLDAAKDAAERQRLTLDFRLGDMRALEFNG
ncbi:MAG TPA: class I SAM-dependent methyltransferase, partial [Polyangiaceae bacterium]|nr:class I SAM-dependent methyltransferase [Polyangiaceae bacterium]